MDPHLPTTMSQEQSFPSPDPEGHIQEGSNRRGEGQEKNEVGVEKESQGENVLLDAYLSLILYKFVTRWAIVEFYSIY